MASWSILPPEIKRYVAKKLDFMSRHSLRSTSYLDRQIVNSLKINIPRVRFGYKESKCLIVIYTGIETFLRLELSGCKEGIIIHRSENSWDSRKFCSTLLPSSAPLAVGISILKSLLVHKSILIGAIEWDIEKKGEKEDKLVASLIKKYMGGAKFRVKEMVVTADSIDDLTKMMREICFSQDLINWRQINLDISSESLVPVMCNEMVVWIDGITHYATQIYMNNSMGHNEGFLKAYSILLNSIPEPVKMATFRSANFMDFENPINADMKDGFKRTEGQKCVNLSYATECGHWTHVSLKQHENHVREKVGSQKCGVGWLCKRCSDPFDYWYYQTLPRRVLYEPFWNNLIWRVIPEEDDTSIVEVLRDNLASDEKKLKKEKKKILENMETSWGFRRVSFEDSEDVSDSESSEDEEIAETEDETDDGDSESEAEDTEETSRQRFRCGVFVIIIPVLLSVVFYQFSVLYGAYFQ